MISFRYLREFDPPAPFVNVVVAHPQTAQQLQPLPAQVDSAADRTIIPLSIAEALTLEPSRELFFEGLGGEIQHLTCYAVKIGIQGMDFVDLEVAGHASESIVLLGRDVLNRHRIVLDGPQQLLEIG